MCKEIIIQSNLFPSFPNEEEQINPRRFGRRLGEFIKKILEKENIKVTDFYPTDFSYELRIDHFKVRTYIQTGNEDSETDKFLIFMETKKSFTQKIFSKIDTREITQRVYNIILRNLELNPEITVL